MNSNQHPFYLPHGLTFPIFFRTSLGRIEFDRAPVDILKASNPDIEWDEGRVLYVVMGWYEILRRDGYRDAVAEDYRALINGDKLYANNRYQMVNTH